MDQPVQFYELPRTIDKLSTAGRFDYLFSSHLLPKLLPQELSALANVFHSLQERIYITEDRLTKDWNRWILHLDSLSYRNSWRTLPKIKELEPQTSDGSIFEGPAQHFISDDTAGDIMMTYLVLYRQFQSTCLGNTKSFGIGCVETSFLAQWYMQ